MHVQRPGVPYVADLAVGDLTVPPDLTPPDMAPLPCPPLPSLVACWRFEGTVMDGTANGNHGTVRVPDSASLDAQNGLTLETWLWADVLPPAGRAGLVDNEGQYGFFVTSLGELRCTVGGVVISPAGAVTTGPWMHVACSWNGTVARLYKNGAEIANAPIAGTLGKRTNDGLAIGGNSPSGDPLSGKLDELRIWNVGRDADDILGRMGPQRE